MNFTTNSEIKKDYKEILWVMIYLQITQLRWNGQTPRNAKLLKLNQEQSKNKPEPDGFSG